MQKFNLGRYTGFAVLLALLFVGVAIAQNLSGQIRGDGSSTVYPVTEAVAEEFGKKQKNVRVTVGISGTGGGFKKFIVGETDIQNASRPIKKDENETAVANKVSYIELPICFDGLAVVINKQNTWCDYLTVEELKKMWDTGSKVNNWKDVRAGFPDQPLKLFGAGPDSGTFDYFTEAINGKSKQSRTDYTGSEDDNVTVLGVSGNKGALGYFGVAYYEENKDKLKVVPIVNKAGDKPVLPTMQNVMNNSYVPLSRPLLIYVNAESAKRPEVAAFIDFYLDNAAELSKEVGYIPLPASAYTIVKDHWKKRTTGTAYANVKPGMSIEQIMSQFK
jgi:phosphate transport system substrate-binding protein